MSFEKIEDYLDKIEAIQNYDKVVNDNNELFRTGNQRATDLNNCHRRVRELEQVRITYNGNEYSLEEFQRLVEASAVDWKQNVRENEVNEKWLSSKDSLISETIDTYFSDYPGSCPEFIRVKVNINSRMRSDSILNNPGTWPNWFNIIQEADAERRTLKLMDHKFKKKVENRAQERLSQIEKEKWPVYVRNKVVPFFQKKIIDQLMTLSEKISIKCPKCDQSYVVDLTPEEMRQLISKGSTRLFCSNDQCRNIFGKQSMSISFEELLIQNGFSPYIERLTDINIKKREISLDDEEETKSENNSK